MKIDNIDKKREIEDCLGVVEFFLKKKLAQKKV